MWVRGLKQEKSYIISQGYEVAPRVGAWIETVGTRGMEIVHMVAPRVGAWIETVYSIMIIPLPMRRTPCGCVD